MPRTLIVAVINFTIRIESDAGWAADTGTGRHHRAVRFDADCPATEWHRTAEGTCQAERHPKIARLVESTANGVLVVVAGDTPTVVHIFKDICTSVAVRVLQPGDLIARGGVQVLVLRIVGDAEYFVQTRGKELVADVGSIVAASTADDPDLTTPGAQGKFAIRHQVDGADLHGGFLWRGKGGDLVKIRFDRIGGEQR